MKKLTVVAVLTIAMMVMSSQAFSQYRRGSGIKFGITGGMNLNNIAQDYDYDKQDNRVPNQARLGLRVGPTMEFKFNQNFSLQTGIHLVTKGYGMDFLTVFKENNPLDTLPGNIGEDIEYSVDEGKAYTNLYYMEIPIKFAYRSENLQVFAGPYMGFNLGGKRVKNGTINYSGEINGQSFSDDLDIDEETTIIPTYGELDPQDMSEGERYMAGFDFGINFGAGLRVENFMVNAGYSLGLANLNPKVDFDGYDRSSAKRKNRVAYLSVSYLFDM